MDNRCNSHGLKLLDLCKATSVRIANGRLSKDHDCGNFTFAGHAGSSVIDYLLLHERNFSMVNTFQVEPFCKWSDHASLHFVIKCKQAIPKGVDTYSRTSIIWADKLRFIRRGCGWYFQLNIISLIRAMTLYIYILNCS